MIRLTHLRRRDYPQLVSNKDETEFDSSKIQGGHAAQCGFFTSVHLQHSFNGGLGEEAFGLAGGLVYRSVNLAQFRHPFDSGRGLTAIQGGHHG